jgi:hypothetical protein
MTMTFKIDDAVVKVTGDYHIRGVVRAVFTVHDDGPTRYVVRHEAQGGGYFCHIYNVEQLRYESPGI